MAPQKVQISHRRGHSLAGSLQDTCALDSLAAFVQDVPTTWNDT